MFGRSRLIARDRRDISEAPSPDAWVELYVGFISASWARLGLGITTRWRMNRGAKTKEE
jgi:hypothetical protein